MYLVLKRLEDMQISGRVFWNPSKNCSIAQVLKTLRFVKVKTEGQKKCLANFTENLKTKLKFYVNPGLAKSCFEQPGPEL